MADEIEMHEGHWKSEGWLTAKQGHWSGVEGAPPQAGKTPTLDGFYGGGKFRLLFPAVVLLGLVAFGGFVVYEESHSEEHGGEETSEEEGPLTDVDREINDTTTS